MKALILSLLLPATLYAADQGDSFTPTGQFGVYNNCTQPVWIQTINQPVSDPQVVFAPLRGRHE